MLYRIEIVDGFSSESCPNSCIIRATDEPIVTMQSPVSVDGRDNWRDIFADGEIMNAILHVTADAKRCAEFCGNDRHIIHQINLIPVS